MADARLGSPTAKQVERTARPGRTYDSIPARARRTPASIRMTPRFQIAISFCQPGLAGHAEPAANHGWKNAWMTNEPANPTIHSATTSFGSESLMPGASRSAPPNSSRAGERGLPLASGLWDGRAMLSRRHVIADGAALLALTLLSPAHAYLLPTPHVLKKATARLRGSKGLEAALVGEVRPDGGGEAVQVGERWRFLASVRVEVNGPDGRTAAFDGKQGVGSRATGAVELLPREPVRRVLEALFTRADVNGLMTLVGARLDAQHLDLVGETPCHVLGAPAGDERSNAIWVDQSDFVVRRVRFATDAGPCDIRLDDWQGPITEGRFPHRLSVRLAGRPVRVMTASKVAR